MQSGPRLKATLLELHGSQQATDRATPETPLPACRGRPLLSAPFPLSAHANNTVELLLGLNLS